MRIQWTGGGILETSDRADLGWKELNSGSGSPVLVDAKERTAFFRVKLRLFPLSVSKTGTGLGAVQSQPAGINCGSDCVGSFLEGTVVQLSALPASGSIFSGWSGDASGTGAAMIVMTGPRSIAADFSKPSMDGLINGDFEQGPQIAWLQYPGFVIYRAADLGVPVSSGQYVARIGYDRDDRVSAGLGQRLLLPNVSPLYLACSIWIVSEEICDPPWWDTIGFYIDGMPVVENTRVCHSNGPTHGWERASFEISAYAGRTVLLGFAISGGTLSSAMYLDDVELSQSPE